MRLTVNAPFATVLGSIPAPVGTVESEGRQMKQCSVEYSPKKNCTKDKNVQFASLYGAGLKFERLIEE